MNFLCLCMCACMLLQVDCNSFLKKKVRNRHFGYLAMDSKSFSLNGPAGVPAFCWGTLRTQGRVCRHQNTQHYQGIM